MLVVACVVLRGCSSSNVPINSLRRRCTIKIATGGWLVCEHTDKPYWSPENRPVKKNRQVLAADIENCRMYFSIANRSSLRLLLPHPPRTPLVVAVSPGIAKQQRNRMVQIDRPSRIDVTYRPRWSSRAGAISRRQSTQSTLDIARAHALRLNSRVKSIDLRFVSLYCSGIDLRYRSQYPCVHQARVLCVPM